MQINHNVAALNAWRNLGVSSGQLSGSLEKLSSGFRINRGADDPAGLLISEQLRAQIGGLDQATRNANDAISMVQTAEGALTEMNTTLNSIRSLAVHAANTGANDDSSIMADQTAVDKAIESIQRIATTTKFAGKHLLDGTSGTVITDKNSATSSITVGSVANSGAVLLSVTTAATKASASFTILASGSAGIFSLAATGSLTMWLEVGGVAQSASLKTYSVVGGQTVASLMNVINGDSATTGVTVASGATSDIVNFNSVSYGSNVKVKIQVAGAIATGGVAVNASATGLDVAGKLGGVALNASGLVLYGSQAVGTSWADTSITLTSAAATTTGGYNFSIAAGDLRFSLTDNASTTDIISYSIRNMQTDQIGTSTTYGNSGLNGIKSGQLFDLATDAQASVAIIDQAIADVSMERAKLGAFQKFTLESTLNNLGTTRENLAASESRIRDVDMAKEMMDFTKNQILVQAGTAMLAQANQLPQTVLKLLQ